MMLQAVKLVINSTKIRKIFTFIRKDSCGTSHFPLRCYCFSASAAVLLLVLSKNHDLAGVVQQRYQETHSPWHSEWPHTCNTTGWVTWTWQCMHI